MNELPLNLRKILLFLWFFAVVISSITFLFIYYKIKPSDAPLALHYNIIVGVDLLGKGTDLYKLPIISFAIIGVNVLLSQLLKRWQPEIQIFIAALSLLISAVLLFATLLLFSVN